MEQEIQDCRLPEGADGAIGRLVAYLWDDELRSFSEETEDEEAHRGRHVFRDIYRLAKVVLGATVLKSTWYSESRVRYSLVHVNGLDVVEEYGEVRNTEWEGDVFREAVGILLGATTELAVALEGGSTAEGGEWPKGPQASGGPIGQEGRTTIGSDRDREALRRVIAYLWDDELIRFTEAQYWHDGPEHRRGHVFRDVYNLAKLVNGATVVDVSGAPEAGKHYALVRVNGLVAVEEDGELDCTDCDGDPFRDAVEALFGAGAESAPESKEVGGVPGEGGPRPDGGSRMHPGGGSAPRGLIPYIVRVVRTFQLIEEVRTEASSPEEAEWLASHHIESIDRRAGLQTDGLRELGGPVMFVTRQ